MLCSNLLPESCPLPQSSARILRIEQNSRDGQCLLSIFSERCHLFLTHRILSAVTISLLNWVADLPLPLGTKEVKPCLLSYLEGPLLRRKPSCLFISVSGSVGTCQLLVKTYVMDGQLCSEKFQHRQIYGALSC